jgi:hypothetical protein
VPAMDLKRYAIHARANHGESGVCCNAAAGGLMLALAASEVWRRAGTVLKPALPLIGVHGSEYRSCTLPAASARNRLLGSPRRAYRSASSPGCDSARLTLNCLVNPHIFTQLASANPVLHLRRADATGVVR